MPATPFRTQAWRWCRGAELNRRYTDFSAAIHLCKTLKNQEKPPPLRARSWTGTEIGALGCDEVVAGTGRDTARPEM